MDKSPGESRFTFFGGKGGTGKTTCAAAFALSLATRGRPTLVVSTDPAHSLGDLFQRRIGGRARQLADRLWGLEIDPEREARQYLKRVRGQLRQMVSTVIVDEIRRQIDAAYVSPGAAESAFLDKVVDLMSERDTAYAHIVFDTAPTGHTLRLMALPERLGAWVDQLMQKRQAALRLLDRIPQSTKPRVAEDPVLAMLKARRERLTFARECLSDHRITRFVLVMDAERLSMEETRRAMAFFHKHGIAVEGVIVNRVLPESPDPFHEKRRELQQGRLAAIRREFGERLLGCVPLLDDEVENVESLCAVAHELPDIWPGP